MRRVTVKTETLEKNILYLAEEAREQRQRLLVDAYNDEEVIDNECVNIPTR